MPASSLFYFATINYVRCFLAALQEVVPNIGLSVNVVFINIAKESMAM